MIAKSDMKAGTLVSVDEKGNIVPFSDGYSDEERLARKVGELLRIRKLAKFHEKNLPIGILVNNPASPQGFTLL